MSSTRVDPPLQRQCVVHHYIRTFGRLPTPQELQTALRARALADLTAGSAHPARRRVAAGADRVRRLVARAVVKA